VARKAKKAEAHGGGVHAPAWMISWADMTTLLWACFVLLWSFSTLDLVKFQAAMSSLQGALGVLQGGAMVLNSGDIPMIGYHSKTAAGRTAMERIRQRIDSQAERAGLDNAIETSIGPNGLTIRFADTALFDPGRTDIKPEVMQVLNTVATELAQISNRVQVEGHSDPTPIHTPQFPSNWELSAGRAAAVVHYFIEEGGVSPERLTAAGYAFYHPVAPNSTAEGRARNRRVDVIVLSQPEESETQPSQGAEPQNTEPRTREDALSYLESPESSGIVMPPTDSAPTQYQGSTVESDLPADPGS
jgi:chemotaxis protein MotB